jgi:hypothetical protein
MGYQAPKDSATDRRAASRWAGTQLSRARANEHGTPQGAADGAPYPTATATGHRKDAGAVQAAAEAALGRHHSPRSSACQSPPSSRSISSRSS